jgi:hypothetical protein
MMKGLKNVRSAYSAVLALLASFGLQFSYAQAPMRVIIEPNSVSICRDEQLLLRYCYRDVPYKPYVQRLFSPQGVNILRDAPADHQHHHALMFAVAVDGVNFWEEAPTAGRQEHGGFTDVVIAEHGGGPSAGFTERLGWIDSTGRGVLTEHRTIEVCQVDKLGPTMLAWRSDLAVPKGKESLTLTGSHYFGLGMRFLRSMDGAGEFSNADGKEGTVFRGEEKLVRSNWCAYTATANGKPVTVAMLGHPSNPRDSTTWFTMTKPFAYLSATLALHEEPLKIASSAPLVLRYAVVLWDGDIQAAQIEHLYREWIERIGEAKSAKQSG